MPYLVRQKYFDPTRTCSGDFLDLRARAISNTIPVMKVFIREIAVILHSSGPVTLVITEICNPKNKSCIKRSLNHDSYDMIMYLVKK